MAKTPYKIPYDAKGIAIGYDKDSRIVEWRENVQFSAKLRFERFDRGRSAAHAIFIDVKTSRPYQMFLSDLSIAIPSLRLGLIEGDFVFAKRGANYGLQLVRAASLPEQIASEL